MADLRKVIVDTGLSDEELALILRVSKGTIYNCKMIGRSLPNDALKKLGRITQQLPDSGALKKITEELREQQIMQLDIITKYRQAQIHKLNRIINNKERKLENMMHYLPKKFRAIKSRSIALNINQKAKENATLLKKQEAELRNSSVKFYLNGPAKALELKMDIARLRAELEVTIQQVQELNLIASQIKELPVAKWPLLLGFSEV